MEKAAVFGPLIIFFVFFALLVVIFFGFIIKLVLKSKNEEWAGEVSDKKFNEVEDFDTGSKSDHYFLVVKMSTGKTRNIGLSREMWEKFQVGDKLKKPKGKLYPDKI
ncbi:MAG TPA: hypothetical protein VN174_04350 [Candidatus Methanoperedens sp.]|nr:hypothetical protein [Candidatus Methanoperedens sp.]